MKNKDKMAKCIECANLDRYKTNENWIVCPCMPISIMAGATSNECEAFVKFAPCENQRHMNGHSCLNRHQCFEPCGELGKSEQHAVVAPECE